MSSEVVGTPVPAVPVSPVSVSPELSKSGDTPTQIADPSSAVAGPPKIEEDGDGKFALKFAALTRREKKILEEQTKLKAEREEVLAYKKIKESKDPKEKLANLGLTLDEILMAHINPAELPPQSTESHISSLRKEIEEIKKAKQEEGESAKRAAEDLQAKTQQATIEAAIAAHKSSISEIVKKDAEKFELINLHGEEDMIWDVTEAYFDEHKQVLEPAKAAEMVEKFLEERDRKALSAKRFRAQNETKEEPKTKGPISEKLVPKVSQTLTSDWIAKPGKVEHGLLDLEASKKRSAALLRWNK